MGSLKRKCDSDMKGNGKTPKHETGFQTESDFFFDRTITHFSTFGKGLSIEDAQLIQKRLYEGMNTIIVSPIVVLLPVLLSNIFSFAKNSANTKLVSKKFYMATLNREIDEREFLDFDFLMIWICLDAFKRGLLTVFSMSLYHKVAGDFFLFIYLEAGRLLLSFMFEDDTTDIRTQGIIPPDIFAKWTCETDENNTFRTTIEDFIPFIRILRVLFSDYKKLHENSSPFYFPGQQITNLTNYSEKLLSLDIDDPFWAIFNPNRDEDGQDFKTLRSNAPIILTNAGGFYASIFLRSDRQKKRVMGIPYSLCIKF